MASTLNKAAMDWKYRRDNPMFDQKASDTEVASRISGTIKRTSGQSPEQKANQDAFDRQMGFTEPAARTNFATAAASDRAARLKKDAYDIGPYAEDTTGTFASQRAPEIVGGTNGAPAFQRTANGAISEVTKATAVSPVNRTDGLTPAPVAPTGALAGPLAAIPSMGPFNRSAQFAPNPDKTDLAPTPAPPPPAAIPAATPTGTPAAGAAPLPSAPAATSGTMALTPNPPFNPVPTPGEAGGRTVAAGVSNAQAAGFEQPTQANPVPKTETSPVMNIDDYDRKKSAFAGF